MNDSPSTTASPTLGQRLLPQQAGRASALHSSLTDLFSTLLQVTNVQTSLPPVAEAKVSDQIESASSGDALASEDEASPVEETQDDDELSSASSSEFAAAAQVTVANNVDTDPSQVSSTVESTESIDVSTESDAVNIETEQTTAVESTVEVPSDQTTLIANSDAESQTPVVSQETVAVKATKRTDHKTNQSNDQVNVVDTAEVVAAKPSDDKSKQVADLESTSTAATVAVTEVSGADESDQKRDSKGDRRHGGNAFVGSRVNTLLATNEQVPIDRATNEVAPIPVATESQSIVNPTAETTVIAAEVPLVTNPVSTAVTTEQSAGREPISVAAQANAVTKVAESGNVSAKTSSARSVDRIVSGGNTNPARTNASASGDATPEVNQQEAVARAQLVRRVSRAFQKLSDGGGTVRVRLSPPHLGTVRVEVQTKDNRMNARITTESDAARNVLNDQLPDLRLRLSELGVQVDRVEIVTDRSFGDSTSNFQESTNGNSREFEPQRSHERATGNRESRKVADDNPVVLPTTVYRVGSGGLDVHV